MAEAANPLDGLSKEEQSCVRRYIDTLAEHLAEDLREVWLFGSAARGDMWSAMPNRSDIDLLVLAAQPVPQDLREDLVNETFPLFLECGRQIGPQFRTMEWFREPEERHRDFVARVREEGFVLFAAE